MSDQMRLLRAVSGASDGSVLDAERALGLTAGRSLVILRRRRLARTVWIAAVLLALALSACTAVIWGLEKRLTHGTEPVRFGEGAQEPREVGYMTYSGYGDSPAGKASMEWEQFYWDYTGAKNAEAKANDTSWIDESWQPEDEALRPVCQYNFVYDQVMLDKLLEIRDKYGVRLHNCVWIIQDEAEFLRATGAEKFVSEEVASCFYELVYEDGSFKCSGFLDESLENSFTLFRGTAGSLYPVSSVIRDIDSYVQWRYTTGLGAEVDIAWQKDGNSGNYILYQEGDYFLTLSFHAADRETAQAVAELFDFSAACRGDWRQVPARIEQIEQEKATLPAAVEEAGETITLEEFIRTPEHLALAEFCTLYLEHMGITRRWMPFMAVYGHPYGAISRDAGQEMVERARESGNIAYGHGYGDETTEADILSVCEKYGLKYPQYREAISFGEVYPYWYNGGIVEKGFAPSETLREDEVAAKLGQGAFIADIRDHFIDWYDTGAFCVSGLLENQSGYSVHYIPKGSLYTAMYDLGSTEDFTDVRMIETACGEVACLAETSFEGYPRYYLLYESPEAYIVGITDDWHILADGIDFTQFK